jgi:hypothetical protein
MTGSNIERQNQNTDSNSPSDAINSNMDDVQSITNVLLFAETTLSAQSIAWMQSCDTLQILTLCSN